MAASEPACPRKISVLFVCLGNICRSPMAEAVFRSLTHSLPPSSPPSISMTSQTSSRTPPPPHPLISAIDSVGTGAYHAHSPPDPRTLSTLSSHGVHNYTHQARKITTADFEEFDYILAMDRDNLRDLKEMKGRVDRKRGVVGKAEVRLLGEFGGKTTSAKGGKRGGAVGEEVVDPYYGVDDGFEIVFEQVERFSRAFLREIEKNTTGEDEEDREGS